MMGLSIPSTITPIPTPRTSGDSPWSLWKPWSSEAIEKNHHVFLVKITKKNECWHLWCYWRNNLIRSKRRLLYWGWLICAHQSYSILRKASKSLKIRIGVGDLLYLMCNAKSTRISTTSFTSCWAMCQLGDSCTRCCQTWRFQPFFPSNHALWPSD